MMNYASKWTMSIFKMFVLTACLGKNSQLPASSSKLMITHYSLLITHYSLLIKKAFSYNYALYIINYALKKPCAVGDLHLLLAFSFWLLAPRNGLHLL